MTSASVACRRLMTIPGVGQLTALAFVAAIDDPSRIRRSRDIGDPPRPVQGRIRGASSSNWITTGSKGPCEMTSVVWPLPVVSSMSQVSPALIVTAPPTPGVTRTLPARQKRIWRPGVR